MAEQIILNIENRIVWKRQILVNFVKKMILLRDRTANVTLVFIQNESNLPQGKMDITF